MTKLPLLFLLLIFAMTSGGLAAPPAGPIAIQELADQVPEGGLLKLEPGTYLGPLVIRRPMTIDGGGQAIIDGQKKGTVILIEADHVTLQNLSITGTGHSHDKVDAAIKLVRHSYAQILNNQIYNALFGIDMKEAHHNKVIGNEISSIKDHMGLRGDAVRAWASHHNHFKSNRIHDSRDMVVWYSDNNLIEDNEGWNNRYSLHFMYTGFNHVRNNHYHNNAVGIFLMYGGKIVIENNKISYSIGNTGMGIGLKEMSQVRVENNEIIYCSVGLYLDQSPFDPEDYNLFRGNLIAHNTRGLLFHSTLESNIVKGNAFVDNLEPIAVDANGHALNNLFEGNYYNDFEGFDRNRDGYGDNPHLSYVYLDSLWTENQWLHFYRAAPVVSMLRFLSKLAPLTEPRLLLEDKKPVMTLDWALLKSKENLHVDLPEREDDQEALPIEEQSAAEGKSGWN